MPWNPTSFSPNLQTHHEQLPTLSPKLHLHPILSSSPSFFRRQTFKLYRQHQRTTHLTSPSCKSLPGERGLIIQVSPGPLLRSAYMLTFLIQKHQISQSFLTFKNRSSVSSPYSPSPSHPPPSHMRTCSLSSPFPPLVLWKTSS